MVMLPQEMRRYSIIAVKNKGRDAWMVNYAVKDIAGGRLRWKRKQNMFWNLEKAQAFLQEHKLEQANNASALHEEREKLLTARTGKAHSIFCLSLVSRPKADVRSCRCGG